MASDEARTAWITLKVVILIAAWIAVDILAPAGLVPLFLLTLWLLDKNIHSRADPGEDLRPYSQIHRDIERLQASANNRPEKEQISE